MSRKTRTFHYAGRGVRVLVLVLAVAALMSVAVRAQQSRQDKGRSVPAVSPGYAWERLSAEADFPKSYNFQLFADSAHVWAFHSGGVWISDDGISWTKTRLKNILGGQAFLDYVRFRGAIYALGTFEGNIERYAQTTQIARTRDFASWEILANGSTIPKRFFCHPFVFRDTLWMIGGEDASGRYDDVWQSVDAIHWTKVADAMPFGKRAGQHFIVFHDSLYMLDHDVWVSGDARNWKRLTDRIAEGEIFGYAAEVFDDALWLIGCNRNGKFRSEVLRSADGVTWRADRAPWSPRGGVATCLFRGRIVMTGGKYGGPGIAGQTEFVYSNDVWSLKKK